MCSAWSSSSWVFRPAADLELTFAGGLNDGLRKQCALRCTCVRPQRVYSSHPEGPAMGWRAVPESALEQLELSRSRLGSRTWGCRSTARTALYRCFTHEFLHPRERFYVEAWFLGPSLSRGSTVAYGLDDVWRPDCVPRCTWGSSTEGHLVARAAVGTCCNELIYHGDVEWRYCIVRFGLGCQMSVQRTRGHDSHDVTGHCTGVLPLVLGLVLEFVGVPASSRS